MKLFIYVLVMIVHQATSTTCYQGRILPLNLPYLHTPTRTHNAGGRPWFFSPKFSRTKRKKHILDMLTSTQTYRPQNLNIYVTFNVESDLCCGKCSLIASRPSLFRESVLYRIIVLIRSKGFHHILDHQTLAARSR